MTTRYSRILITGCIPFVCIAVAVSVKWKSSRADFSLIAGLLKIDALPHGTKIVEIRKDLLPDTVVECRLIIPAGTVGKLIAGIPLEECKTDFAARYDKGEFHAASEERRRRRDAGLRGACPPR